jgi:hypothetical protein
VSSNPGDGRKWRLVCPHCIDPSPAVDQDVVGTFARLSVMAVLFG